MNVGIQGLVVDVFKVVLVCFDVVLEWGGYVSCIVFQVYDEVFVEVFEDEREVLWILIVDVMRGVVELWVFLEVNFIFGVIWVAVKGQVGDCARCCY